MSRQAMAVESFVKRKAGADQQPEYKGNDRIIGNQLISERIRAPNPLRFNEVNCKKARTKKG
jgi:hypothetical protein